MKQATFITSNQHKADYLAKYLGRPLKHANVELEEIQSLELKQIVEHKVKQAFSALHTQVLVEDVALEFTALGKLPGPFIKFFLQEMSEEDICRLLDGKDRSAIAKCVFGYYDGTEVTYFEGNLKGSIAEKPRGIGGYGWDKIFIPEGYEITRAEMSESDDRKTYLKIKPLEKIKKFLEQD